MGSQVVQTGNILRGKGRGRSDCGSFTIGKGYRKTIGLKAGNILARFWLGMDEREATIKAKLIEAIWLRCNASHWSPESLAEAERVRRSPLTTNAPESIESPRIEKVVAADRSHHLNIGDGVEQYCNIIDAKDCSSGHKRSTRQRLKTITRLRGLLPLSSLDCLALSSMVAQLRSQPDAHNIIRTTKAFLRWADDMDLWDAPRKFERIFTLARKTSTPVKISVFTIEQLTQMYSNADQRIRLWILLGLNCGFANMEVATLLQSEVNITNGYIERARQKTGISGKWKLWEETHKALKPYCNVGSDEPVFKTDNGNPLVWFNKKHIRTDSLSQCWKRFMIRSNAALSFKYLRKTGATMIRSIDGIEVSETYLAHADKGIARFYSIPDGKRLGSVGKLICLPVSSNVG